MFKQLCKHFPLTLLIRQPIFTWKTYNHAVTYNHASADGNPLLFPFHQELRTQFTPEAGVTGFPLDVLYFTINTLLLFPTVQKFNVAFHDLFLLSSAEVMRNK